MTRLAVWEEDELEHDEQEEECQVGVEECLVCHRLQPPNQKSSRERYQCLLKSTIPSLLLLTYSLYTGTTKRLKITRKQNDGSGRLVQAENVLEVTVKPGWKAGTKIRFPNAGDELVPGQAQTIAFVIEEKPHPVYKRDGDDLSTEIELSLVEAFTGFSRNLQTLDGRTLKVAASPGNVVQPGEIKLFAREGMPNQRTGGKGNLRVKLNVKFPKTATKEQMEGVKRLFG
jgi:DnaJ family protein B protein 4